MGATNVTAPEFQLRRAVTDATPQLVAITDAKASQPRSPGKWSRKQIVGHLIDSASNNHERFVRAQFTDDLLCPTYDQDAWVTVQRYGDAPWAELVALWSHFNLQLARVIEAMPAEVRSRPRHRHNLDRVAFRALAPGEPATLEFFMRDYVVHLEHHLGQILG
jgi:hypothetical protein